MTERWQRLIAIVRADFLVRFRRPSTVVIFLLLSAMPYLWIPDPALGRALIQIGNQRALYNSAAIGMATAMMGTICIGLFGYYVVSNAIKRDVVSRAGFVMASTTMRGSEYIVGKFAGNVVFLSVFLFGFMLTAMVMQVVRGEAPLEPLVFARQYLILAPPAIVFVSAIAITFESLPLLRGKFGDVFYFFLWLGVLSAVASRMEKGAPQWLAFFDVSGFGLVSAYMKETLGHTSISVGASNFDPKNGVAVFAGLPFDLRWGLPRLGAAVTPVLLLPVARLFFHRFDPVRVRAVAQKSSRTWLGRINALLKPIARVLVSAFGSGGSGSLLGAARADAVTSIAALPLIVAGIIGLAIAATVTAPDELLHGVMPIAFAGLAVAVADVASREKRSGTVALIFATPRLRTKFVFWKFGSALLVGLLFLAVPLVRATLLEPSSIVALVVGIVFVCAAATALGVVSANPKTFLVGFLTFWYVVTNDRGLSPALDFAGFYGTATPAVIAAYAFSALALLALAHIYHLAELRRRW